MKGSQTYFVLILLFLFTETKALVARFLCVHQLCHLNASLHLLWNDYQMRLSYQVYAPIFGQDRCFHRTLFLFCCKSPECYKSNDSRCMKGNYFGYLKVCQWLFLLLCSSIQDSGDIQSLVLQCSVSHLAFLTHLDHMLLYFKA